MPFSSLPKNVGGGVPENSFSWWQLLSTYDSQVCSSWPSRFSKSRSSSLTDFSNGRSRSQSSPSTWELSAVRCTVNQIQHTFAMTTRSARLFDRSLAISSGDVSQLFPFRSVPSGIVIVIPWRGCSGVPLSVLCLETNHWLTSNKSVILRFQMIEHLNAVIKKFGRGFKLS